MPKQRYGRAAQLTDRAKDWFADRGFEISGAVSSPYQGIGKAEGEFQVYKEGMMTPKTIIILNGSTQARNRKLGNWLRYQGDTGFFAIDECGSILYIEGCNECGGAKKIEFQGFIAPKLCNHYSEPTAREPVPPSFLQEQPVMEQVYYILEHGVEARNSFDFTRGRYLLDFTGNVATHYLFSAKHLARYLNIPPSLIRDTILDWGAEAHNVRRFSRLQRLWRLPIRPPSERSALVEAAEQGEDLEDFWEASIDNQKTHDIN